MFGKSTFKNWHKNQTLAKSKNLSSLWATSVMKKGTDKIQIKFTAEHNMKIVFDLDAHDTEQLLKEINKHFPDFKTPNK